jgi:hypothetical protein
MMSFGPPGGNGTISLIGLIGKSCAGASAGSSASDNPASIVRNLFKQASPGRRLLLRRGHITLCQASLVDDAKEYAA